MGGTRREVPVKWCLHKHYLWIDITTIAAPYREFLGYCGGIRREARSD